MPRLLRIVIPLLLIAAWLGIGAVGGPLFGRVSEVSTNSATTFLPSGAEATEVQKLLPEFLGDDAIPAIVVFTEADGADLTPQAIGQVQAATEGITDIVEPALSASPVIPSKDGKALQWFVELDASGEVGDAVDEIRTHLDDKLGEANIDFAVTGPGGFSADLSEAFGGIDGILLLVALGAVLIILMIVYRAPIVAFTVLLSSLMALCAALAVVWVLAREGVILLNGQTQGILFILVIGAATDYGLLYVARYREELKRHADKWDATKAAWKGSFEPILASGGTVIAGLLCLTLSQLQSNRDLGPIASIGIAFAMLASFTLLPAALYLFGRVGFWPRKPHFEAHHDGEDAELPQTGLWAKIPNVIARSPRKIWVTTTAVLLLISIAAFTFKASGVAQSDLILGGSEARDGQKVLAQHFPAGSGNPAQIVVPADAAVEVARQVAETKGVDSVSAIAADSPSGQVPLTAEGFAGAQLTVVDDRVLIQATMTDAFDSNEAEETVRALREAMPDDVLVGGTTATDVDSNDASVHDRNLIIPVVLVVITLILGLLLRAVVAPLLLIATVVLSFAATLGVSALVFNHVFGFAGAEPGVPLFAFVFLVALGVDYNIFLMSRVREETKKFGTKRGIARGLAITGGVITSAGLVLAATFAALGVVPILFLAQLAFMVAFGVLLDTFVVRTLLLPALAEDIGKKIWWPSALAKGKD